MTMERIINRIIFGLIVLLFARCNPTTRKRIVFDSETFSLTYVDKNLILDSIVITEQSAKKGNIIFRTKLPSDNSALLNTNIFTFDNRDIDADSLFKDHLSYSIRFYGHDPDLKISYYFKTYYKVGEKFADTMKESRAKSY